MVTLKSLVDLMQPYEKISIFVHKKDKRVCLVESITDDALYECWKLIDIELQTSEVIELGCNEDTIIIDVRI